MIRYVKFTYPIWLASSQSGGVCLCHQHPHHMISSRVSTFADGQHQRGFENCYMLIGSSTQELLGANQMHNPSLQRWDT